MDGAAGLCGVGFADERFAIGGDGERPLTLRPAGSLHAELVLTGAARHLDGTDLLAIRVLDVGGRSVQTHRVGEAHEIDFIDWHGKGE